MCTVGAKYGGTFGAGTSLDSAGGSLPVPPWRQSPASSGVLIRPFNLWTLNYGRSSARTCRPNSPQLPARSALHCPSDCLGLCWKTFASNCTFATSTISLATLPFQAAQCCKYVLLCAGVCRGFDPSPLGSIKNVYLFSDVGVGTEHSPASGCC